jgi:hypothetical protein
MLKIGGFAMDKTNESGVAEKKLPEPMPVDAEERWDWEFYQDPPPPLRRWKVRAQIVWKGRAEPMPSSEPDDEC